jgi:hypothetical protein
MRLVLLALVVGVSLQSHYFYGIDLPLISVASLLVLAVVLVFASTDAAVALPLNRDLGIAGAVLLALAWSMVGLVFYGDMPDAKRVVGFVVLFGAVLVGTRLAQVMPVRELLRSYLVVHVGMFWLQFLVYYTTGVVIDVLEPITGEQQRVFYGTFTVPVFGLLLRPAGLFNEPGTYATFVGPVVALYERWLNVRNSDKRLFAAGLLSLFLSFSTFGIVFGLLIVLCSRHLRFAYRAVVLTIGIGLAVPYLHYRFVLSRAVGADDGLGFRQVFIQESFAFLSSSPLGLLFGSNLLVLDPRVHFTGAYNDTGLLLYMLHFAGPVLTLMLVFLVAAQLDRLDRPARVAVLVAALSKISPFAPIFGLLLVFMLTHRVSMPVRGPATKVPA